MKFHFSDKAIQVVRCAVEIGDVLSIGESKQVREVCAQDELTQARLCAANGAIFILGESPRVSWRLFGLSNFGRIRVG